ncbi:YdaS family helix-turn-helix protein [Paraburkholderia strydomiana]|uniref:transcriptional regulator n=1 Tax=Paraburkholderia strydomiana TaxID=1245417 RepID=UPI0038B73245
MDKLIAYLNSLDKTARADFAARCRTSEGYMRKARSTNQKFRCELCVRIERESQGAVTRRDLRDDWQDVWPELAKHSRGGGANNSSKSARMVGS